jgi:hypothetical protein
MDKRNREPVRLQRSRTRLTSERRRETQGESRALLDFDRGDSPSLLSSQGVGTVALGAFAASLGTFILIRKEDD